MIIHTLYLPLKVPQPCDILKSWTDEGVTPTLTYPRLEANIMTASPQKVLADKVVTENDWDTSSTFAASEVAELIDQIVKSIVFTTRNGALVSTDMVTHVWFEVADNLRYGVRSEG